MSHIDELPRQAGLELKEQDLAVKEGNVMASSHSSENTITDTFRSAASTMPAPAEPDEEPMDTLVHGQEAAVGFSEPDGYTTGPPVNGLAANEDADAVTLPSSPRSDSSSSSMDESVDPNHSTSFEEADLYGFQETPPRPDMEDQIHTEHIDQMPVTGSEGDKENPQTLLEDYGQDNDHEMISKERSPESDAYEPPEPETGAEEADTNVEDADEADESYSPPPFSPAAVEERAESPRSEAQVSVEVSAESPRSRDQSRREALTWARPGPYLSEPKRDFLDWIFRLYEQHLSVTKFVFEN
jgi:hypothetical protein